MPHGALNSPGVEPYGQGALIVSNNFRISMQKYYRPIFVSDHNNFRQLDNTKGQQL
jgi:hypothetical protein